MSRSRVECSRLLVARLHAMIEDMVHPTATVEIPFLGSRRDLDRRPASFSEVVLQ